MAYNLGSVGTAYNLGYTGTYTGGGITYPYELTSHGTADPNSIMADANFATTGTVEIRIISDFDPSKVEFDWQAFSDQQLWRDDVNTLDSVTVNATEDTTDSATIGWKTPDGTEGQFTATVNITEADTAAPTVTSVGVPTAGSYAAGQDLDFTVNASETVTVTTTGGTPSIPVTIGSTVRQAEYVSGSGTSAMLFRYTIQSGDNDGDGIAVGSSISLNGGAIQDGASNNLVLTLNSIGDTSGVLVDTVKPVITPPSPNPLNIVVGGTFTNTPATAFDSVDGNLGNVAGVHSVDTNTIGQYTVTYPGAGVVDSAGNVAEDATRIVNVVAEDFWPFGKGIKYATTKNWEWGKRHPKTGMRVRVYK